MRRIIFCALLVVLPFRSVECFSSTTHSNSHSRSTARTALSQPTRNRIVRTALAATPEDEEYDRLLEEARLKVYSDRRRTIRWVLKNAESTKNYRVANNLVPDLDPETGKPIKSDGKSAVTITAFVVAGGAVLLRLGGRAALVSALGLDFASENPELKDGLESVLGYASTMGTESELFLFILAWTVVKVFCFDAGGVILALASGILFGGVIQGAVVSAFAATVGSSAAFGLAKIDTPVRTKALDLVEEYPSLRGIEKVVAKDGLKAILTLRLAPVLPIPIGLYNYVYGVTNVPYLQFAGGIFLGSLKPYLLDSYLGVFGKQIVDGTAQDGGLQDFLLLVALGVSVLIGVFASQLAEETWDSINEEVEAQKAEISESEDEDDVVMTEFMGMGLPQFIVKFQLALQAADERVNQLIEEEMEAKVWNCTMAELDEDPNDPAKQPGSVEVLEANQGFNIGADICNGLCLSPALLKAYLKYADPLYDESAAEITSTQQNVDLVTQGIAIPQGESVETIIQEAEPNDSVERGVTRESTIEDLFVALRLLRVEMEQDIEAMNKSK